MKLETVSPPAFGKEDPVKTGAGIFMEGAPFCCWCSGHSLRGMVGFLLPGLRGDEDGC